MRDGGRKIAPVFFFQKILRQKREQTVNAGNQKRIFSEFHNIGFVNNRSSMKFFTSR
jgi:hypothetical protein